MQEFQESDSQVTHRVPTKLANGDRPIVALLKSRHMRNQWLAKQKQYKSTNNRQPLMSTIVKSTLSASPVYIHEHITVRRKLLLSQVKTYARDNEIKFVWIKDGAILIKKNET